MALYLEDARLLDEHAGQIRRGSWRIDGGATAVEVVPAASEVLRCGGRYVTRAFVNAHQHVYSALARGMPAPRTPPTTFVEILERIWWKLDRALDLDMVRACAQVAALDAARAGVTVVIDHHSSPTSAEGSLACLGAEFERTGLRSLLCLELSDRDGPDRLAAGVREHETWLRDHPGLVGLHASFTVSDATLERAVDLARRFDTGLHVHVAEALSDQEHCTQTHGRRVIERFAKAGVLASGKTLLAHGLHLNAAERTLVASSSAWVVQNEESNQNNAVGRFTPQGLGPRLLIGTDGMHGDALQSTRAAFLAAQSTGGMSPTQAWQRLRHGHDYLAGHGLRTEDDLIVWDYDPPTPVTPDNWPAHALYGLTRANVLHVIAQGRLVVKDRRVLTIDQEAVLAHAREQAQRLWRRL